MKKWYCLITSSNHDKETFLELIFFFLVKKPTNNWGLLLYRSKSGRINRPKFTVSWRRWLKFADSERFGQEHLLCAWCCKKVKAPKGKGLKRKGRKIRTTYKAAETLGGISNNRMADGRVQDENRTCRNSKRYGLSIFPSNLVLQIKTLKSRNTKHETREADRECGPNRKLTQDHGGYHWVGLSFLLD